MSTYLTYGPFSMSHALTLGSNQGSNLGTEAKQLPENDPMIPGEHATKRCLCLQ